MTKGELIKGLAELKGVKKKEAEAIIAVVDEIIELAVKGEGKCKIGSYFTVEKVHKEEKKGEAMGKTYVTPEHDEIVIKRTQAAKRV